MRIMRFIIVSTFLSWLVAGPTWSQQSSSGADQGTTRSGANAVGTSQNEGRLDSTKKGLAAGTQQDEVQSNAANAQAGQGAQSAPGGGSAEIPQRALNQQPDPQRANQQQRSNELKHLDSGYMSRNESSQENALDNPRLQNDSTTPKRPRQEIDRNSVVDLLRKVGRRIDDWRVVEHNGRWWYWTPEQSWMYFNDGNWLPFRQGIGDRVFSKTEVVFPPGYPTEDWRLVNYSGRWWYWTPGETWLYLNGDRWNPYRVRSTALRQNRLRQRYRTGYRGSLDDNPSDNNRRFFGEPGDSQRTSDQMPQQRNFQELEPGTEADARKPTNADRGISQGNTPSAVGSGRTPPPEPKEPSQPGGQKPSEVQGNQSTPSERSNQPGGNQTQGGTALPSQESSQHGG